jgi:(p)ppGpp synthase/HD superfamily hydrolase
LKNPNPKSSHTGTARKSRGRKRSRRLTEWFIEALSYAATLHANQKRKGSGEPYIGHLLGVASLVLQHGGDEVEAIAALLHDAAEDQGGRGTLWEIERKFGNKVAAIVEVCSDTLETPKPPFLIRKKKHVARNRRASPSVRLVYAADKLHNARSILADYQAIGERLWPRFSGGKEGTLWYYREMTNALKKPGAGPLVKELSRVVAEIDQLAV